MRKGKREYAAGGVVKGIKAAIKAKAGAKKRLSKEEQKAKAMIEKELKQELQYEPFLTVEDYLGRIQSELDDIPSGQLKKMLSKKDRRALAKSIYGNPGKEAKRPFKKGKSGTSKMERDAEDPIVYAAGGVVKAIKKIGSKGKLSERAEKKYLERKQKKEDFKKFRKEMKGIKDPLEIEKQYEKFRKKMAGKILKIQEMKARKRKEDYFKKGL